MQKPFVMDRHAAERQMAALLLRRRQRISQSEILHAVLGMGYDCPFEHFLVTRENGLLRPFFDPYF